VKRYKPEVPMMTFQATPNELIALGHVATQYIIQVRRIPHPTKEQLEIVALLSRFQGRLVQHVSVTREIPQ
jgi:hypothetical protein